MLIIHNYPEAAASDLFCVGSTVVLSHGDEADLNQKKNHFSRGLDISVNGPKTEIRKYEKTGGRSRRKQGNLACGAASEGG